MKRRIFAVVGAGAILLSLTACGNSRPQTEQDIVKQAQIVEACHSYGGLWLPDSFNNYSCVFDDRLDESK